MGDIQRVAKFLMVMMVNVIGGNERLNNSYEGKNKYK